MPCAFPIFHCNANANGIIDDKFSITFYRNGGANVPDTYGFMLTFAQTGFPETLENRRSVQLFIGYGTYSHVFRRYCEGTNAPSEWITLH